MRLQPIVFLLVSASLFAQGAGDALRSRITESAQKYLGVPYIYGAESPSAFDCSGFVHYVYKTVASLDLPRNSKQQWIAGMPIKLSEAQPGDVVVFDTTGAGGPSHVAIFLGDGRVIHAISEGPKTGVVISVLDKSSFGRMVLGYRLFLAPVTAPAPGKAAQEAQAAKAAQEAQAAKAAQEAQAAKAVQEAAVKAAREAAAKAVQEAQEAKAAQEAAARAAEEARAAKAAQEAAAQTAQEFQAAQVAKAAQEAAARAAQEAQEAQAAKVAQDAAAKAAQEAAVQAAKDAQDAQAAKAAQEAAVQAAKDAQAAQAASPAPAKPAAAPFPSGPPIAQIGFDIPVAKVTFTDKIPAATGTGIAFTLRNATGKAGRFVVIFYKAEVDFSKSTEIHRELVDLPKDGALEIPPYVFKDAGTYKLIVKDNWNTQLLERIFKVIELKK